MKTKGLISLSILFAAIFIILLLAGCANNKPSESNSKLILHPTYGDSYMILPEGTKIDEKVTDSVGFYVGINVPILVLTEEEFVEIIKMLKTQIEEECDKKGTYINMEEN